MPSSKGLIPKTVTTTSYPAPSCVRCSQPCKPVFPSTVNPDGTWSYPQVDNGLVLEISGGYGMYIDPGRRSPVFVLCGECIDIITASEEGKWIADAIKEVDSAGEWGPSIG